MTPEEIIERIESLLYTYTDGDLDGISRLVAPDPGAGKLYEAFVLAHIAEYLVAEEGLTLELSSGSKLVLKSAPGPINRKYPYLRVYRDTVEVAEIWTDVEFVAYSCTSSGRKPKYPGDYHELDIVVVDLGISSRPMPNQLWLGIECKHRSYSKNLLRELLGVRRELGLLSPLRHTRFTHWPRTQVPSEPPVCLMAFSSHRSIAEFSEPGEVFGIDFKHLPLV